MSSWVDLLASDKLIRLDGKDLDKNDLQVICNDHPSDIFYQTLSDLVSDKDSITVRTSGSTGPAKGIEIPKEKLLASALATNDALQLKDGSVLAHCLSCGHIGGIMMLVRAIVLKAELIRLPVNSDPLKDLEEEQNIDLIAMVPMQVINALKNESTKNKLARIKNVIIGGASINPHLAYQLSEFPNSIYSTFGMTETLSHIALRKLSGESQDHFKCIGPTTVSIDDESRLIINAPHLSADLIHSNDMVELIDEKRFRWLGRYDNVINSGGIKLNPEVLEAKIASRIKCRFFFASKPDPELGEALVLYIEGSAQDVELADLLNKFELPREIIFVEKFKEAANGKIVRRKVMSENR